MASKDLISRFLELQRDSARIGIDFLRTDLQTAMTFAERALQSANDPETQTRNKVNARKGYDSVAHLLDEVSSRVSEQEKVEIEDQLRMLKSKLLKLGETFA